MQSAWNIALLGNGKIKLDFVGSLVPDHHRDLLRVPVEKYTRTCTGLLAYRTRKEIFESVKTIVIVYNRKTALRQEHIFEKQLQKTVREARKFFESIAHEPTEIVEAKVQTFLKTRKIGSSQALRFFKVKVWHNGWRNQMSIRRKRTEVLFKKASFGKTILFTSLHNESTEAIISYYRSGSQIEDAFHHLKDRDLVSYYPAYHWTDSKLRVHAFVCVLTPLLIKLLCLIANREGLKITTDLLIEELADITEVLLIYRDHRAVVKISHMSSIQKKLFQIYELDK